MRTHFNLVLEEE
jgi:hypothetical protein